MTDAYRTPVTADDVSVGDTGPTVVEDVTRVGIAKYAGASGDFNRIHVDEPFATDAGNESVFAHGMLTAGYAAHMVSDWFGLDAISRFRTRFTSRAWPGDTVTVTGEVTEKTPTADGATVEVEFAAVNGDGEELLVGDATVDLPDA